ncbi:MAG TPA: alanine--glyoxylate aminotransferase family protein [Terriglobia bacterium]|nr:alanine--glyoxylate aminotransferase family protein [Terriglobia bacterium]
MIRKPLLFLPGPMQVPEHIRVAGERPLFSHRSRPMLDLLEKLEAGCRPLFGTQSDVIFLAASGTGSMESAIANLTSPGDEILVVIGGTFSERWKNIAEGYGLTVRVAEVDWRNGATPADLQKALDLWPKAGVVFITWSESSTGVLIELDEIGKLVRSQGRILVADAVSGLAVSPMAMDSWNVDAVVVGSQKGLMLPPGLGVVAIGPRAWEKQRTARTPRFYWDWSKYKAAVPFTPALSLLFQLDASLNYIHTQGKERIFARRAAVADQIRGLVRKADMEIYAARPGNGITGVIPPPGFDIEGLIQRLDAEFGIQIGEGQGQIKKTTFRIGHVGHLTDEEIDYFTASFEKCLREQRRS